jgi:hypothetical protein
LDGCPSSGKPPSVLNHYIGVKLETKEIPCRGVNNFYSTASVAAIATQPGFISVELDLQGFKGLSIVGQK